MPENSAPVPQNSETLKFVLAHRSDDVRRLALQGAPAGIDIAFALNQIQGWQTARKKLPTWAENDAIIYPPHLNMEQCSSELTAKYKAAVLQAQIKSSADGTVFIDLTGGFGVDFSYLSRGFTKAVYVERNEELCAIARQNFQTLGLRNAEVICGDGTEFLQSLSPSEKSRTTIFLDPARRDFHGQRVFGISDCTPDVLGLRGALLERAATVMLKLSPMLDWHAAARDFAPNCREVHIVSTRNECKELLILLKSSDETENSHDSGQIRLVCVNDDDVFEMTAHGDCGAAPALFSGEAGDIEGALLYIPNSSVMKASQFACLTERFPVEMADRGSHLFLSREPVKKFPGRAFTITGVSTMNRRELRKKLGGISRANVAVRNFPLAAEALRQRLRLSDGGDTYIFGTTVKGKHLLIIATPLVAKA